MTEFESIQLLDNAVATLVAHGDSINSGLALFYTLLFSYIVAAYVAGAALTVTQVFLATGMYCLVMLFFLVSMYMDLELFWTIARAAAERAPEAVYDESLDVYTQVLTALNSSLVFASLYFMWTVRHPKCE